MLIAGYRIANPASNGARVRRPTEAGQSRQLTVSSEKAGVANYPIATHAIRDTRRWNEGGCRGLMGENGGGRDFLGRRDAG